MDENYSILLEDLMKTESKEAKKEKKCISDRIKNEFKLIIKNLENTDKLEKIYKFRYAIFNAGIRNPELEETYMRLLKKVAFTDEKSIIFANWDNVFTTIFGNIPVIYNDHGKDYPNRIINMFCNTKNELKLNLLMLLFRNIYNIEPEEMEFVDKMLLHINKTEENYILKSYESIVKYLYNLCDKESILYNYKNFILEEAFAKSKSGHNSGLLSDMLEIFVDKDINNHNLINLFKVIAISDNRDVADAYFNLINDEAFINLEDTKLQDRCIKLLDEVKESNYLNIHLITEIILNIIILSNNKYIQDYLLDKIKRIKRAESLELILMLTPILKTFSNEDEYVRVIDTLEDKNSDLTKKLIINLNCDE